MSMRIMHVVDSLGKGGLENGLVNVIRGLDARRFEHVVCTIRQRGDNTARLPVERVRVVCLADHGSRSRVQTPALVRMIRQVQPDVVHSRNWSAIEAVTAGRLARVPAVVHSEHGFETTAAAKEPRRRIWFRRLSYELADRVLAVSFQLRDWHAARTGFPASRFAVIQNGVDRGHFFPDPDVRIRVRDELRIREQEFCIGCVANLLPVKDHMTLLQAIDSLAVRRRDWRLIIVGEGPERVRLKAFVDAHPAWKDRVSFLGLSSRVPDLLRAMDVFVLTSIAEGMCNSLLEAMATGLPVLATAVGGNPEIVVDGESGLLFPAGDVRALASRLWQLCDNPRLRPQLGHRAVERVRNQFSIESMIRAYEQLYLSLRPTAAVPVLSPGRR